MTTRPRRHAAPALLVLALMLLPQGVHADFTAEMKGPYHMHAPAVGETSDGRLVGVLADAYVTASRASGEGGGVFLDTRPLLELDMQGSARMAARVAQGLAGANATDWDVFIAFRSTSSVVGGPSAGALLSTLILATITGHPPKDDVTLTGAVLADGSVGPVGGVPEKAEAAARGGKRLFLFPAGEEVVARHSGEVVEMEFYCREELAITCRPVVSVEEAYAAVTGFALQRPPPGAAAIPDRTAEVLGPAATALLANATKLKEEAEAALGAISIPADLAPLVTDARERAEATLAASQAARERGEPYTASSKAFQAAVEARAMSEWAAWQASGRSAAYVDGAFARVGRVVDEAAAAAEAPELATIAQLQAVGAAQTRAREAQELVRDARNETLVPAALRDVAFATERAATVHWWISISRLYLEGPPARRDRLEEAVDRAIEGATDGVAYAKALVNLYQPGRDVRDLDAYLSRARTERERGFLASALFTAVEADIRAGLLFAVGTRGVAPATLDRARETAQDAVAGSRARGVEPILAASYLQFGSSLRNETPPNPTEAYVFFQLARTVGRLPEALDLGGSAGGAARFAPVEDGAPTLRIPAAWMPALLSLGVATGVVAALVALARKPEA